MPLKRKAGFYLPESYIDKLDKTYLQLKLNDVPIANKSQLIEFALDLLFADLEQEDSTILSQLENHKK